MKPLLRVSAVFSFGFCFVAGLLILGIAVGSGKSDAAIIAALGLLLMGVAFFIGGIFLAAAERVSAKATGERARSL